LVNTKTPEETEAELTKVVPKKYWLKLNHAMVRFGQKICLPRNPLHEECALKKQCDFFKGRGRWKK
jgi:endonuclease-3